MPDLNVSAGGDLNIGGGLTGRDSVTRDAHSEREWDALNNAVGRLQSDMVTVRLKLAQLEERLVFWAAGFFVSMLLAGVSIIIAVVR